MKTIVVGTLVMGLTGLGCNTPASTQGEGRTSGGKADSAVNELAAILHGKRLSCTNARGEETLSVSIAGEAVNVESTYGDGDRTNKQLTRGSIGDLLLLAVEGPDPDEGGAIVTIDPWYLDGGDEGGGCADSNAVVYSEGVGDGDADLERLTCCLG